MTSLWGLNDVEVMTSQTTLQTWRRSAIETILHDIAAMSKRFCDDVLYLVSINLPVHWPCQHWNERLPSFFCCCPVSENWNDIKYTNISPDKVITDGTSLYCPFCIKLPIGFASRVISIGILVISIAPSPVPTVPRRFPYSTQRAHGVYTTSYQRRCNVVTSHRRWYDVLPTLRAYWAVIMSVRLL